MPKELFGTDGIRGVPGTAPLDDATLYATGQSLGTYLKQTSPAARVLIGMDTRESGPHIAAVLAAGIGPSRGSVDLSRIITKPGASCPAGPARVHDRAGHSTCPRPDYHNH